MRYSALFLSLIFSGIVLCASIVPDVLYSYSIHAALKLVLQGVELPAISSIRSLPTIRDRQKLDQALEKLAIINQVYPNHPLFYQLRALIFAAQGNWSHAIATIEQTRPLAVGLRWRMLSWDLALIYENVEREPSCRNEDSNHRLTFVTDNRQLLEAWQNVGYTPIEFEKIGDFFRIDRSQLEHAIVWYRRAVKLGGDSFSLWYNIGITSRMLECQKNALIAFQQAVQKDPLSRDAWWELGNMYEQKNELSKALRAYQKGLTGVGTIGLSNFYAKMGRIYQREGTTESLIAAGLAYSQAVTQNNFYSSDFKVETHYQLGHVLGEQNRWTEAIQIYEQALLLSPNSYAITVDLAFACSQLGDLACAVALWNRALEQEPNRKEAYLYLGNFYQINGHLAQAQKMYTRVMELDQNK